MLVCNKHLKAALHLLEVPHVQKSQSNVKCSFCNDQGILNVYYTHQSSKQQRLRLGNKKIKQFV